MQFKQIIIQIILVFLLAGTILSQQSNTEPGGSSRLDSLLLSGNLGTFISIWDGSIATSGKEQYSTLSNRLKELEKAPEERIEVMCREADTSSSRFQTTRAGQSANVVFERFLKARSAGQCKDALTYYFIALHFRSRHIANEKRRLRANLVTAENGYIRGQFDEALQAVAAFRSEDPTNPAFIVLRDSLSASYDKLETKSAVALSAIRRELASEVVRKHLTVSFSGGMAFIARQQEKEVVIRSGYAVFSPELFPNMMKPYYSLQVDYFLSPVLAAGLALKSGSIYNADVFAEPFGTPDPARIHIEKVYVSIASGATYYFREKTGLRPFVHLAAGALQVHRYGAKVQSAKWEDSGVHAELKDTRTTYPVMAIEIGSEYEPGLNGLFYFGVHASLSNHFGDSTLIKHFLGSGEVRIGINVL